MLLAVIYSLVRSLLDALVQGRKTDDTLLVEVLALRHQLRVLRRVIGTPNRKCRRTSS
jgi:hypothetical protein